MSKKITFALKLVLLFLFGHLLVVTPPSLFEFEFELEKNVFFVVFVVFLIKYHVTGLSRCN